MKGKILIGLFSNRKLACSKVAGDSLFIRKNYTILENGVDLDKYLYNLDIRNSIRSKYNIKEQKRCKQLSLQRCIYM